MGFVVLEVPSQRGNAVCGMPYICINDIQKSKTIS